MNARLPWLPLLLLSLTALAQPSMAALTVTTPNDGQTYAVGQTIRMAWTLSDVGVSTPVPTELRVVDAASHNEIATLTRAAKTVTGTNSFDWTIPAGVNQSNLLLDVRTTASPSFPPQSDTSDIAFSILQVSTQPRVSIIYPNAGETLQSGSVVPIQWGYNSPSLMPNLATSLAVTDATGNEVLRISNNALTNNGVNRYDWTVPAGLRGTAFRVRVIAAALPGLTGTSVDYSDGWLAIEDTSSSATLSVTNPSGGESFAPGQSVNLEWTLGGVALSTPVATEIRLYQVNSYGATGAEVAVLTKAALTKSGVNRYSWTVPANPIAGNYSAYGLRAEVRTTPSPLLSPVSAYSNNSFSIIRASTQPRVSVIFPNKGETLRSGERVNLQWSYDGPSLSYGPSWQVAATVLSIVNAAGAEIARVSNSAYTQTGVNSRSWTVPAGLQGANLRLKVVMPASTQYAGQPTDASDGDNTIQDTSTSPGLTVTNPSGGESLNPGQTVTIEWSLGGVSLSTAVPTEIRLYSVSNYGTTGSEVALLTRSALTKSGINRYSWTVPANPIAGNYMAYGLRAEVRTMAHPLLAPLTALSQNSFSIVQTSTQPRVSVIFPNKGETLRSGETVTLQWSYDGPYLMSGPSLPSAATVLSIVTAGGTEVARVSNSAYTQNGINSRVWTVPAGLQGANLRLKVLLPTSTLYAGQPSDMSDADNTVLDVAGLPALTVTNPSGGELLTPGQTLTIEWSLGGVSLSTGVPTEIRLYAVNNYGTTGNEVALLTRSALTKSGVNRYSWTVPANPIAGNYSAYGLRAEVRTVASPLLAPVSDYSDNAFSIVQTSTQPRVSVVFPNKGETLRSGEVATLQWSYDGPYLGSPMPSTPMSTVLSIVNSAGTEVARVANSAYTQNGINSRSWTVPAGLQGSNLRLKVMLPASTLYAGQPADMSDGDNTFLDVAPSPTLVVTNPNEGETWAPGQTVNLEWTLGGVSLSTAVPTEIRLYAVNNFGATGNEVALLTRSALTKSGVNRYSWTVPANPIAGNYSVYGLRAEVRTVASPLLAPVSDYSENAFSIVQTSTQPRVSVVFPNKGETLRSGENVNLQWSFDGPSLGSQMPSTPMATVLSIVTSAGTEVARVANNAYTQNGINSRSWTVPAGLQGTNLRLKVVLPTSTLYAGQPADLSDGDNTFQDVAASPTLTVTNPSGGETFAPGQTVNIEWSLGGVSLSTAVPTEIRLYSVNTYGATGNEVALLTRSALTKSGVNRYSWTVPANPIAGNYVVYGLRAEVRTVASPLLAPVSAYSENVFSIVQASTQPRVSVIFPNKGETLRSGETVALQWSFDGPSLTGPAPASTVLSIVNTAGVEVARVANNVYTQNGINSRSWTVPAGLKGTNLRLKATLPASTLYAGQPFDSSDGDNTFLDVAPAPTLTVTNLNGGETLVPGQTVSIEWAVGGTAITTPEPTEIRLMAAMSDGRFSDVAILTRAAFSAPGINRYSWTVPVKPWLLNGSGELRVQVRTIPMSTTEPYYLVSDTSDGSFFVTTNAAAPRVSVVYPNKGERLASGDSVSLTWSYDGPSLAAYGAIPTTLSLVTSTGTEVLRLATSAATVDGLNHWQWTVPAGLNAGNLRFKVQMAASPAYAGQPADTSDGDNIVGDLTPYLKLSVNTPAGGETFTAGEAMTAQWTMQGIMPSSAPTQVSLLDASGQSVAVLSTAALSNVGTNRMTFQLPALVSGSGFKLFVLARIPIDSQPWLAATSNAFTINPIAPPTVVIATPTASADVYGTVDVQAVASGPRPVTGVEFYADGVYLGIDTIPPYSMPWNANSLAAGPHVLSARAFDTALSSATAVRLVNVTAPPADAALLSAFQGFGSDAPAASASSSLDGNAARAVSRVSGTGVRVFPNPWRGDRDSAGPVRFEGLPSDAGIKVFTVSGQWVRTIDVSSGAGEWDVRNQDGERVASGIYLYTTADGNTHGKVIVIR